MGTFAKAPRAIKICGLKTTQAIDVAVQAGARFLGFNFFAKSPRAVDVDQARALCGHVPVGVARVGLLVDPSDDDLERILARVPLDIIQLHGAEPPARVSALRARYGLPVMKVVGLRDADDLPLLERYAPVSDMLLVDAKAPKTADLPGGNGVPFDWRLIAGRRWPVPWMLAGGLTPDNVRDAMERTGARIADVSSGVESAPGEKDPALIRAFADAALGA